ncbi:MAG: DNA-binding protein [Acidobacteria bacterium]|nr:MAG: DNA-binding protein [Acidobacteriota bacterium]
MSEQPESYAAQWVARAENDPKNAERALELGDDCPFDTVAFHAQQCVEKYLKAWLVEHGVEFARTHDLVVLVGMAKDAGLVGVEESEVLALNRFAVEARYPGEWDPIRGDEAIDAVEAARRLRGSIRESMELAD